MGRNKVGISFDIKFLKQLKESECNCVELIKHTHHLALHPYQLEKLNNSIKDTLNKDTGRYNRKLEGILLGYQNIKLLGDIGDINLDSCFIHIDIQAEFYVFKPEVGKVLTGIVNKKSTGHVGVLVHNTFNVSLPKPSEGENWIGDRAHIGNEVTFKIVYTDLHLRLPYIRGELLSITETDSGIGTGDETVTSKKKKLNKIKKFQDSEQTSPKKAGKRKLDSSLEETPKLKKRKHTLSESERAGLNESLEINHISDLAINKRKIKTENIDVESIRNSLLQEEISFDASIKSKSKKNSKKGNTIEKEIKAEKSNDGDDLDLSKAEDIDIESLTNSLLQEQVSLVENMKPKSKKKSNKKDKKQKYENAESKEIKKEKSKEDDEISLPDLNLSQIFNSSLPKSVNNIDMADSNDKSIKKRRHSVSQASLNFSLLEDSDLDHILSEDKSLKRKRSSSESHSKPKRKRKISTKE